MLKIFFVWVVGSKVSNCKRNSKLLFRIVGLFINYLYINFLQGRIQFDLALNKH